MSQKRQATKNRAGVTKSVQLCQSESRNSRTELNYNMRKINGLGRALHGRCIAEFITLARLHDLALAAIASIAPASADPR